MRGLLALCRNDLRTAGEYFLRLIAISGALTASAYSQQPAAPVICRGVLCDQPHNYEPYNQTSLDDDPFRALSHQGSGPVESGSPLHCGYGGGSIGPKGLACGGRWAPPFASCQQSSPRCDSSNWGTDRTVASSVPARNDAWPRRLGFGEMSLLAWNQQNSPTDQQEGKSSSRQGSPGHIFWIVPAFHVAYVTKFVPLTPREKFDEWLTGTYDPRGIGLYAFESATLEHSSSDGFCGYGKGWGGYGKCFGATELDANFSSFFGDFLFPVLMHEDPRYFRLGQGSFGKRLGYAVSRVFVTHADSGRTVVFASALSGSVLAAAASNLYYARKDRGVGSTLDRVGLDLGNTALFNVAAEFWPDIQHGLHRAFGRQ